MITEYWLDGTPERAEGTGGCGSDDGTAETVTVVTGPDKMVTGDAIAESGTDDGMAVQEMTATLDCSGTTMKLDSGTLVNKETGTTYADENLAVIADET
jgi:hypothetical protein